MGIRQRQEIRSRGSSAVPGHRFNGVVEPRFVRQFLAYKTGNCPGYLVPEIAKIANPNLMALTDGAINQDIEHLPKSRYRVPSYPFDPDLQWKPFAIVSARSPQARRSKRPIHWE
jgi:hypothetical protein